MAAFAHRLANCGRLGDRDQYVCMTYFIAVRYRFGQLCWVGFRLVKSRKFTLLRPNRDLEREPRRFATISFVAFRTTSNTHCHRQQWSFGTCSTEAVLVLVPSPIGNSSVCQL